MEINSKEYWDNRFKSNDWILAGGDNQNKYFYNVMLELIPNNIKEEIQNNSMSICDFGCAEGNGLEIFSKVFVNSEITGVDISEHALINARKKYIDINFTTKIDKEYDLIISSNTLEHFNEPYQILDELFHFSKKYVILLLPFREYQRIDEHLYTFDFNNIIIERNKFKLFYINWINSNKIYWDGQQIILIYMKNAKEELINNNFLDTLSLKSNSIDDLENQLEKKDLVIEEKQSELMKISDWATQLKKQIEEKDLLLQEKQSELMKILDWATQLRQRVEELEKKAK